MNKKVALILISMQIWAAACSHFGCNDTVQSETKAPDGVLVATVVTTDCGATTGYSTTVNLHRSDHGFGDQGGNIFVAAGQHHLSVQWTSTDRLVVQCEGCSRSDTNRMTTKLGRTNVTYKLGMLVSPPSETPGCSEQ